MKWWLGLGSNVGDRRKNLERAVQSLALRMTTYRVSPIFETEALLPAGSPEDWDRPYLNAAVEVGWPGSPEELLSVAKRVEREWDRQESARWSPRTLDIDILACDGLTVDREILKVPHGELANRQFALGPLKHLNRRFLKASRMLSSPLPAWMGVLNLSADSFSGADADPEAWQRKWDYWSENLVQIVDVGAESTRPGARRLSDEEEWDRLGPALDWIAEARRGRHFAPLLSVDTYHARNAARALERGADMINDVSGLTDQRMLDVIRDSDCQYVLMHSLSVPADRLRTLNGPDPTGEILEWAHRKLGELASAGVALDRVLLDPGLGFGKRARQSLTLVRELERFYSMDIRLVYGHSRKSFLDIWGERGPSDREWESTGLSLSLAERGVDVIRVHDPVGHARALRAFRGAGT